MAETSTASSDQKGCSPKTPSSPEHHDDHYAAVAEIYSSFPLYNPESSYCKQYVRQLFDTLELDKPDKPKHVVDIGGMYMWCKYVCSMLHVVHVMSHELCSLVLDAMDMCDACSVLYTCACVIVIARYVLQSMFYTNH